MSAIARFLAKVDLSGGPANCQEWTGARSAQGYGAFGPGARREGVMGAHRWLLGYLRGRPLERGELALHHCDVRACVNPLHLYVGTYSDNLRDAITRERRPRHTGGRGRTTGPELCGTVRGYSRHRRHDEEQCRPCLDAKATESREKRRAAR